MADDGIIRFVYRFGSATNDALTPRPKDLMAATGSRPGLSVELSMPPKGQKAQKLDLALLRGTGLAFFADDESLGGRTGHGIIAPVREDGSVDENLLREWSTCRGSGVTHRFTEVILNAIVECDVRSSK